MVILLAPYYSQTCHSPFTQSFHPDEFHLFQGEMITKEINKDSVIEKNIKMLHLIGRIFLQSKRTTGSKYLA